MALHGRVGLVTGASAGIGEAIAVKLAGLGARLVLGGRNAVALAAVKDACLRAGAPAVEEVLGDVTDFATRAALVQKALDAFGKLDVLVNNAGTLRPGKSE